LLVGVFAFANLWLIPHCATRSWLESVHPPAGSQLELRMEPHRVALVKTGRQALADRRLRIEHACCAIRIQTFSWKDDPVSRQILDDLQQAAERGVEVQVLVDALFLDEKSRNALRRASKGPRFEARIYGAGRALQATTLPRLLAEAIRDWRGLHQRMHNKVTVVDDVAIVGGRNIADEYFDRDPTRNYYDLEIAVQGPAVSDVVASFDRYWSHSNTRPLHREQPASAQSTGSIRETDTDDVPASRVGADLDWHDVGAVAFWADPPGKPSPDSDRSGLAVQLGSLLAGAQRSVLMQTPYLILSRRARELFGHLREEGVRLQVHTNSLASTDNWLTYAHTLRQRRTSLRELGLEVSEMRALPAHLSRFIERPEAEEPRPLSMHGKAMVIDDRIALVGSYNLDPRSAMLNTEAGFVVADEGFARVLSQKIRADMAPDNSWIVARRERPLPIDLVEELMEQVNALAMGTTTLDVWPVRYSSCFRLRKGHEPVPSSHPAFYERYQEVGLFPEVGHLDEKLILVELTRTLGGTLQPLL
jgi:phosphatidylserine/phosphatidylglycerophosphate/cardiolipin synthase-like enzyme